MMILETERLRLTPLALSDLDIALALFTSPAVMQFLGRTETEREIREGLPLWIRRGGEGCLGIWCIADRGTGEKFGSGFLLPIPVDHDEPDWHALSPGVMPAGDIEVGYFLKEQAWGKGYATETCRRLLRFAFEETPLTEVVATLDDAHAASKHVLQKCGLTYRGRRRAHGRDSPDWRITREEWLRALSSSASSARGRPRDEVV